MKYKNKLKKLEARQKQWDAFGNSEKAATTRPGSQHK